jgi:glycosyltransferase involved in cell wall biosynthesis
MERYLRECMDSILCQTVKDLEIICVDDGSKDSSPDILREYSGKDNRIVVITKENSGYGDSMNRGLERATGKYIGIVEPDDFIEPDMFETLLKNAEGNDLDISRCTFLYLEEATGEESEEHYPFMIKDRVYAPRDCPETFFQQPSDWVNLYRKDFLDRNDIRFLPTPGASFQDTSFLFKAYAAADRFMITDRQLYHYRINENSSVRQKSHNMKFSAIFLCIFNCIYKF